MTVTVRYMQEESFTRRAEALAAFTEQTGIEVTIDLLPAERFWQESRAAFGDPPSWDLLVPDEAIVAEQLHRGTLEPLGRRAHRDSFELDDFLQAGIDAFRAADMVYAVPYAAKCNVLIYRRDVLHRYGLPVPATWEELRQIARAAQAALRAEGQVEVYGFASSGRPGYGHNFSIIGSTLFPSWGWHWNRGSGQPPRVEEPATIDALAFYAALLHEAGPPDAAILTSADARRLFREGKVVFLLDIATELAALHRDGLAGTGYRVGIARVPTGPTGRPEPGLQSPAFCIPVTSAVKDEAWELLKFLASHEEMVQDAIAGGAAEPASHSVFTADAYAAVYDPEFRLVVGDSRRYARINRPLIPFGFDLGEIVGTAAAAAIAGEMTAAEALRGAQRTVDAMRWTTSD